MVASLRVHRLETTTGGRNMQYVCTHHDAYHERCRGWRERRTYIRAAASSVNSGSSSKTKVTVVGAGVIGLTSAWRLKQRFQDAVDVEIVAEKIASDTTSEGAGGLWKPFALTGTDDALVNRWGKEGLEHYMKIYLSPDAPEAGILLTSAYELYQKKEEDPQWKDVVPGFRHLSQSEIAFYDPSGTHEHGIAYDTIIAEGKLYMKWVMRKLEEIGVTFNQRRLEGLDELKSADIVVNCTGLGARELVKDASMYGIRGHVLRVKAPWVRHHVESHSFDDTRPAYIIPNTDTVVLGGTKDPGNEDIVSREEEREEILERCKAIVPSLAAAELVSSWVGLRPGRNGIRLELEHIDIQGKSVPCIHNYGHGGSGLTLAWGCAGDVVTFAEQVI